MSKEERAKANELKALFLEIYPSFKDILIDVHPRGVTMSIIFHDWGSATTHSEKLDIAPAISNPEFDPIEYFRPFIDYVSISLAYKTEYYKKQHNHFAQLEKEIIDAKAICSASGTLEKDGPSQD